MNQTINRKKALPVIVLRFAVFFTLLLGVVMVNTIYAGEQKPKTVTGTVLDAHGPLSGANVMVKGTLRGVTADANGMFSLPNVNEGDVLVFSFLGYDDYEIVFAGQANLKVVLSEKTQQIGDIVVTAFGAGQKKESIVGSIQTIRPSELKVNTSTNLSNSFAGRMAGVVAYQRGGQPGENSSDFYIRGISTISGVTSPLIILDGVQVSRADLNALDPDVIDGFSILKDATATAMYGSRGANGVMIVTTKSGGDFDRPIITARVETRFEKPINIPKFVDAVTYMKMYNEAVTNQNSGATLYPKDKIEGTINNANPYIYPDVNWYDEIFNDMTFNQKATFNIRGGGKRVTYFMNVAVNRDEGMLKNTSKKYFSYSNNIKYMRYAFQNNLDFKVSKTTKLSLKLNTMITDLDGPSVNASDIYGIIMNNNPVDYPILFPNDGKANWVYWGALSGANTGGAQNPMAEITKGYKNTFESTVIANLNFEQKLDFLTEGLKFRAMVSFKNWSQTNTDRKQGYNKYSLKSYEKLPDGTYQYELLASGSPSKPILGTETNGTTNGDRNFYGEAVLSYDRTFWEYHNVGVMLVANANQYNVNLIQSLYDALPRRKLGYAARVSYDYAGKYMFEFNAGYNGSENFAKGKRFGFFPSVAVGWNVSRESFFKPIQNIVSNLKFKASYGLVGNDQIGGTRFIYLSDVSLYGEKNPGYQTGYGGKTVWYTGPKYNRYQNNNITWEVGKKLNVGIETRIYGIGINFDVFREIRSDIFQEKLSIPNYLGTAGTKVYGNLASVKSWGFDGSVDYRKNITSDLQIAFMGTFTYARNKVLKYDQAPGTRPAMSRIGKPVNTIWGYVSNHLYIDAADVARNPKSTLGNIGIGAGDIKYLDQPDKDGKYDNQITTDDRVAMGYPSIPEIVYGFGPSVTYKKWDFSLFFQGAARVSLMMSGFHPFSKDYNRSVLDWIAKDYWSENNQNIYAKYPRLTHWNNNQNQQPSDFWLRSGSFLKLKNIELGYNFKNYRVYFNAANLFTVSPFKHWDPELGGGAGLRYPNQRTFTIGFQMTFNNR